MLEAVVYSIVFMSVTLINIWSILKMISWGWMNLMSFSYFTVMSTCALYLAIQEKPSDIITYELFALSGTIALIVLIMNMPEKASKKPDAYVTGWIKSFGKPGFYQGIAGRYSSFWYRLLGLSNFEKGYDYKNLNASTGDGSVRMAICFTATEKTDPKMYESYVNQFTVAIESQVEAVLYLKSEEAICDILQNTAEFLKQEGIKVDFKKIDYFLPPKKLSIYCP